MIDPAIFFSLFIMGLVSSAHCIGMCGGIMGALTMAIPADANAKRWMILVAYNLGRITSYTIMGLLAGFFAEQFAALGGGIFLRVLAGTLLIAMGLYLADWWRGLTRLETLGRYFWVYIQPIGKQLMPVNNLPKALLLGGLWGWLPCGLVYTALAMAMTQPAPLLAGSAMLAFGLGTLPAVLAAGIATQGLTRVLQQRQVRMGLALIIIVFGVWTIWGAVGHNHHHHNASHAHNQTVEHIDMDHSAVDHSTMDHSNMDHTAMNHNTGEQSEVSHSVDDHSTINDSSLKALERQRTDTNNDLRDNSDSEVSINSAVSSSVSSENLGDGSAIHHH